MHPVNGSNIQPKPRRRLLVIGATVVALAFGYLFLSGLTMTGIAVGDKAPDFAAKTHSGEQIRLADYFGKKAVVLYFYPKDNTAVCTAQACSFRDSYEQFVEAGAEVIGVSSDNAESHRGFAAKQNLQFQLISDADGALRKAFGVPKTLGFLPGRVTYVIDREGIVRHVFNSQLNADRHISEALKIVRELSQQGSGDQEGERQK